jgi:hypothetical protein
MLVFFSECILLQEVYQYAAKCINSKLVMQEAFQYTAGRIH